jgi:SAM-dependent methyltransferase
VAFLLLKGHEGHFWLEAGRSLWPFLVAPMQEPSDELTLYNRTRKRLSEALAGQLPGDVDLEDTLTAYAYWVCTAVSKRGTDWEAALHNYTDVALRRVADESEAERREMALLHRELARARGPVLDVGAGWGRLARLYDELGLQAVYAEPAVLGVQLMRRAGLGRIVRCVGEALPLADGTFPTILIGWVLHHDASDHDASGHDASDLDAAGILCQAARVTAPGGMLLSVEPLGTGFDQKKWTGLLTGAGFEVHDVERFFETEAARGVRSHHALAIGTRRFTSR